MKTEERLISRKEAATLLGVDLRTIDSWIKDGVVKGRKIKRSWYVDKKTILALVDTEAEIREAQERRGQMLSEIRVQNRENWKALCFSKEPAHREQVRQVLKNVFRVAASQLPQREYEVIDRVVFNGESLEDIGMSYSLTRERVRQIMQKGIRRLHYLEPYDSLFTHCRELERRVLELEKDNEALREVIAEYQSTPEDIERAKLMQTRIVDCNYPFSVRAKNIMHWNEIETVGDLATLPLVAVKGLRNCGAKTMLEFSSFLNALGLGFRDSQH